jgi:hypothetical protein
MNEFEKEINFAQKYFKASQELYALVWRKENNKLSKEDEVLIEELKNAWTNLNKKV